MKKSILVFVFMATWLLSFSQDQNGIARVNRIDGVEAYFMNEPLNDYEVVFDVGTGLKAASLFLRETEGKPLLVRCPNAWR